MINNNNNINSFISQIHMEGLIVIDGSLHQGGGQMIRSSIALSIITHKQFRMHSIRKNRPNPGINNQLKAVFGAFTQKTPKVGDSQVYFYPKYLYPSEVAATTAASCTLMMQCLVPVLTLLNVDKQTKIIGGTDVAKSPPVESIKLALIPLLKQIGIHLKINDIKRGYFPIGKGYVDIQVEQGQYIRPINIKQIGVPQKVIITYYIKDRKAPGSSKQFSKQVKKLLTQAFGQNIAIQFDIKAEKVFNTKDNYGIGCLILGKNLIWDIGTVGEKVTEEIILERLYNLCEKKPVFDQHHQDQLLIYLSLANGTSQLFIGQQESLHTKGLIYVIKSFIPQVQYEHNEETGILKIKGVGIRRGGIQQK